MQLLLTTLHFQNLQELLLYYYLLFSLYQIKNLLVVPEGLKPSTYGLENRCSIQLS